MNCAGSSYCQIIGWSLTMKRKKVFWNLQKFSSFSEWFVVFVEDDAAKRSPSRSSYLVKFPSEWQKKFGKGLFVSNWKTCSWYWLLESFRRHYEGPLTEVLPKLQWTIEKLIQDNVVVLRTFRLPRDKFVHLRDEVDWCASAGSACEEKLV
jgi:hypothetical protein